MSEVSNEQVRAGIKQRAQRRPFGSQQQKLAYPKREGFHRHWFNDIGNRLSDAVEAGYKNVADKDGKNVSRIVGSHPHGGPLNAYLMEIPEEWWKEDQAAKQKIVDETDMAIREGAFQRQQGDNRYVPAQGISVRETR